MPGEKMAEEDNKNVAKEESKGRLPGWVLWAVVLLAVFLLGFVPMWLQSRSVSRELTATQKQLRRAEVKNLLTTAIVEAQNGEYEAARQNMSDFFTNLNGEIEKGDEGSLSKEQREKLKVVFNNRDDIITLLAQRDPASVSRLTDIYGVYKQAMGQAPMQTPVPPP